MTVICTSKASRENFGNRYYDQPYWIQFYIDDSIRTEKDCGGRDCDSDDSKGCTFTIQSATQKDSGNYTCWAHNQITCTQITLNLEFRGKLFITPYKIFLQNFLTFEKIQNHTFQKNIGHLVLFAFLIETENEHDRGLSTFSGVVEYPRQD